METARPARSLDPARPVQGQLMAPVRPARALDPARPRWRKAVHSGSLLLVGASVLTLAAREPPADYVYLGRTVTASQRARQLRAIAAPPVEWTTEGFDDTSWAAVPVTVQPPSAPPLKATSAGALWQTAAPASVATAPPPEPVLIFADDIAVPARLPQLTPPTPTPPKSEAGKGKSATVPAQPTSPPSLGFSTLGGYVIGAAVAVVAPSGPALAAVGLPVTGGGPGMAADAPTFPSCSGALYARRHFDLGPEAAQLSGLTLRIKYTDSFAAYLNGVEVVRKRLPEAVQTVATTLANDRGNVEPESFYLPVTPGRLREHDNLLAIEVHAKAIDRCAKVDFELLGAAGPKVVHGPYIERLVDGTLDLTLETDLPALIELHYGKGETPGDHDRQLVVSTVPQTMHRARITGLRPGKVYHYQASIVGPGDARSELPVVTLHTPPPPGRPLRVVLYGDSRSGHAIHAQLIQAILDEDPDFVLNTGDIVERGTEDGDWDRFFAVAGPLIARVPVYFSPGNHEYAKRRLGALRLFSQYSTMFPLQSPVPPPGAPRERASLPTRDPEPGSLPSYLLAEVPGAAPMPALGPGPTAGPPPRLPPAREVASAPEVQGEGLRGFYSLDVSGVHLVAIDSNQIHRREQLHWLAADLQAAEGRHVRATLAWMHDGPFSTGYHGGNTTAVRDLVPLLERYHVSLLVSGHDHDYERGRHGTLNYVVTGGGGAELRPLRCGIPGKRRCKNMPLAFFNEHHYVRLDVLPDALQLCPRRLDGSPLEECQTVRLPAR